MTKLVTRALEALRKPPDEQQDELAPFLLALADDEPLTEADRAATGGQKPRLHEVNTCRQRPYAPSGQSMAYDRLRATGAS